MSLMVSENSGNEPNFIRKFRRWRWSYWLPVATLVVLWCYAVYEVISYFLRS